MKGVLILVLVVLAMAQLMVIPGEATVTCEQVDKALEPCLTFLTTGAGNPPDSCCEGVRTLRDIAQNPTDARAACICVKEAAGRLPIKVDATAALPGDCNVKIDFPISKDIDCKQIQYDGTMEEMIKIQEEK